MFLTPTPAVRAAAAARRRRRALRRRAVVLVVAESRYVAEDACELVEVDYEPLDAVVDVEARLDDEHARAPRARLEPRDGRRHSHRPGARADLRTAAHVVSERIVQHRHTNVPMETRGIVVALRAGERRAATCAMSDAEPARGQAAIARVTGVRRASRPGPHGADVGGGFGQKLLHASARSSRSSLAACRLGRTHQVDRGPPREPRSRRTTRASTSRLSASRSTPTAASSAPTSTTSRTPARTRSAGPAAPGRSSAMLFPGPYRIPTMALAAHASVWTNTCGRGAYRGPWMFETVAREEIVDLAAAGDRHRPARAAAPQRRADAPSCRTHRRPGCRSTWSRPAETLEQAAEIIDYDAFRAEQRARVRDEGRLLGIGIGLYVEPEHGDADPLGTETATVRVEPERDRSPCSLGTGSHGQGIETTMAQVVAEQLGVDYRRRRGRAGRHRGDAVRAAAPAAAAPRSSPAARAATRALRGARPRRSRSPRTSWRPRPRTSSSSTARSSVRGTPTRTVALAEVARVAYNSSRRAARRDRAPGSRRRRRTRRRRSRGRTRATRAPSRSTAHTGRRDDPPLRRQRGLRRDDQPDDRRGPDRGRRRAGHRRRALRALRLRRRRQPAHDHVHGLPAADRDRGADDRVRPRRDAVARRPAATRAWARAARSARRPRSSTRSPTRSRCSA